MFYLRRFRKLAAKSAPCKCARSLLTATRGRLPFALVAVISLLYAPGTILAQTQIGSDIDGEAAGDHSGLSVSLSSDGTIIAVGAPDNDGTGAEV